MRTSARNQLRGKLIRREDGDVSTEAVLGLVDGKTLTATITREAADDLDLKIGDEVIALIKAPHVILAVD